MRINWRTLHTRSAAGVVYSVAVASSVVALVAAAPNVAIDIIAQTGAASVVFGSTAPVVVSNIVVQPAAAAVSYAAVAPVVVADAIIAVAAAGVSVATVAPTIVLVVPSDAEALASGETEAFTLAFNDDAFFADDGHYGSAFVLDTGVPSNNYNSHPYGLLTYTAPSLKMRLHSDGLVKFQAHNLFLNSASPANQSITVVSGATYRVTITGATTTTASGAATGTWTAGDNDFTAATTTLTLGSTSGAGTVHVRRTPSDDKYLATTGAARYDLPFLWDASSNLLGLLYEGDARTNLLINNKTLSGWTDYTGTSVTSNTANSLSGKNDLVVLTDSGGASTQARYRSAATTSGTVYTASCFAKAGTNQYFHMQVSGTGTTEWVSATWDLSNGTLGQSSVGAGASATIVSTRIEAYPDGWYRCSVTYTMTITSTFVYVAQSNVAAPTPGSFGGVSYTGTGLTLNLWMPQLEAGLMATSPVETYAASVTRAADDVSLATSATPWQAGDGTLYWRGINLEPDDGAGTGAIGTNATLTVFNVVSSDALNLSVSNSSTRAYRAQLVMRDNAGATQSVETGDNEVTVNTVKAFAASFDATTNAELVANGGTPVVDATMDFPGTNAMTTIKLGHQQSHIIKQIAYFPRRLTGAEMQALTS